MAHRTARRFGSLVLSAMVLASAAGFANAQLLDNATNPEIVPTYVNPDEAADMVFNVLEHDFGTISDTDKVEFVFKFTNKGKGPLHVVSTKGSCSCTVPALSKKDFEVGEGGEIRVIYNPKGKAGMQVQNVTVNTNDADTPVILLTVKANVLPEVMVKPKVGHFGEVPKDTSATLELTVTGRNPKFEVTGVELSDPDIFDAEFGKTVDAEFDLRDQEGNVIGKEKVRQCKVTVHMHPGQPIGLIRNKLLTITTNDEKHPKLMVELMAQHVGDLDVMPRRISLGSLVAGTPFKKQVVIKSRTGKPFKILDIEHSSVTPDAVKATFEPIDPDNPTAYRILVSGTMPADARVLRGRLTVKTDVDREGQIFVHYYGQRRPARTPAMAAPKK